MRNSFLIAYWIFGSTVLVGLTLRWRVGDHLFLARYTGYIMPWLLLGLLPGIFWAGMMHYRGFAFILGISTGIIFVCYLPLFWPPSVTSNPAAVKLKVISYNTWSKNYGTDGIARIVKEQRPDVLLLQEMKTETFRRLTERLQDLYPDQELHFSHEPGMLLAIISRYPAESRPVTKGKGRVQRVVLHSPAGPLAVYNVHMLRRGGWGSRYRKIIRLLQEDLVPERWPVILGGDFNSPDRSDTYKFITKYLNNAHREAGFGFGFSFPASSFKLFGLIPVPPLVRIDHIFVNDNFVTIKAGTIRDSGGSDHFPVMAVLEVLPP